MPELLAADGDHVTLRRLLMFSPKKIPTLQIDTALLPPLKATCSFSPILPLPVEKGSPLPIRKGGRSGETQPLC